MMFFEVAFVFAGIALILVSYSNSRAWKYIDQMQEAGADLWEENKQLKEKLVEYERNL